MAKTPATPKPKTAAPAQFDMNSRDRKGGGKGGPRGRDRDEKRPPSRIVNLPPALVDRGQGWVINKIGKVDQASHKAVGAVYELVFEGHDPLSFDFLGAARDRAKEPPPEKIEATAEMAEEMQADETDASTDAEPVAEEHTTESETEPKHD